MSSESHNIRAFYSGNVQGVGFRYTVSSIARSYPNLTGFVRNLPDGRVEMFAEAAPANLDAFLSDIRDKMSGYISDTSISSGTGPPQYTSFEITY
jgi:acylphosphatase